MESWRCIVVGRLAFLLVAVALLGFVSACSDAGDEVKPAPADTDSPDASTISLLLPDAWGLIQACSGAAESTRLVTTGDPVALHRLQDRPSASSAWDMVRGDAEEFLVPIMRGDRAVAEFGVRRVAASQHDYEVVWAGEPAGEWTAIAESVSRLRKRLGDGLETRVVSSSWTAVVGRSANGATGVVFCLPRLGFADPRLTQEEQRELGAIREGYVYLAVDGANAMRRAFPLAWR